MCLTGSEVAFSFYNAIEKNRNSWEKVGKARQKGLNEREFKRSRGRWVSCKVGGGEDDCKSILGENCAKNCFQRIVLKGSSCRISRFLWIWRRFPIKWSSLCLNDLLSCPEQLNRAVQNSQIGELVTDWLTHSTFTFDIQRVTSESPRWEENCWLCKIK